jgi:hypothetical protein
MTEAKRPGLKQMPRPDGQNPDLKKITVPDFHEVQNRVLSTLAALGEEAERTGGKRFPRLLLPIRDVFESRAEKYATLAFENIKERVENIPGPAAVAKQLKDIERAADALAQALAYATGSAFEAIHAELDKIALASPQTFPPSKPLNNLRQFEIDVLALVVAAKRAKPLALVRHGQISREAVKTIADMAADDFAKIAGRRPGRGKRRPGGGTTGFCQFLEKIFEALDPNGITPISERTIQDAANNWKARQDRGLLGLLAEMRELVNK